jgi:hypothetical protein
LVHLALGITGVRQQGNMPGFLDRRTELALVGGAGSENATGNDLSPLSDEISQRFLILVVDAKLFINAESADLFS